MTTSNFDFMKKVIFIFFSNSDYRPMSALDRYDPNLMDDEDYSELSQGDRAAAEAEMRKRDRAAGILRDDRDLLYGQFIFFLRRYFKPSL